MRGKTRKKDRVRRRNKIYDLGGKNRKVREVVAALAVGKTPYYTPFSHIPTAK
jgi:hypothetical protein